jgi:predicted  nucleic acid-binding Zn-ribbon protein
MAEVSNELIYKLMLDIQAEQRQMRAEQDVISQKIGTTAETLVGIKREISVINSRLDSLEVSIQRIHTDIGTLAVAVDEHTRRLDLIEKHLGMDKTRN